MPTEVSISDIRLVVTDEQAALLRVLESVLDAAGTALARVRSRNEFENAVGLVAAQVFASGRAVKLLCVAGHANQALPVARAMVEHAINIAYIAREPRERAKRFWAHRAIAHFQVAQGRELHGAPLDVEGLKHLQAEAAEARRVLAPHKHWDAGVRLKARAKECGLGALYDVYYSEGSAFSHGDASMFDAFVNENGTSMDFGPSPKGIEAVVGPAIAALYGVSFLVSRVFSDEALAKELGRIGTMLPEQTKRIDMRDHFEVVRRSLELLKKGGT
jgi:hypothetical protein